MNRFETAPYNLEIRNYICNHQYTGPRKEFDQNAQEDFKKSLLTVRDPNPMNFCREGGKVVTLQEILKEIDENNKNKNEENKKQKNPIVDGMIDHKEKKR